MHFLEDVTLRDNDGVDDEHYDYFIDDNALLPAVVEAEAKVVQL